MAARDYAGYTPLHHAASQGTARIVSFLLTLPEVCDALAVRHKGGKTAEEAARSRGRTTIVDMIATAVWFEWRCCVCWMTCRLLAIDLFGAVWCVSTGATAQGVEGQATIPGCSGVDESYASTSGSNSNDKSSRRGGGRGGRAACSVVGRSAGATRWAEVCESVGREGGAVHVMCMCR